MSITLSTSQIKSKIENGKLELYFPHSLDLSKKPINVKLVEWINHWGFRVEEKGDITKVLYPHSFNLDSCFYRGIGYDYVQSINFDAKKIMDTTDFLSLVITRFIKSMQISKKSCSIVEGISETDKTKIRRMSGYNLAFKQNEYSIDDIFFKEDAPKEMNIDLYVGKQILTHPGHRILYLITKKDKKDFDLISENLKRKFDFLEIGSVDFKGLKKQSYGEMTTRIRSLFGDYKLAYNVVVGIILSSNINSDRLIDLTNENKLRTSNGIYLSETLVKLKDLGIVYDSKDNFNSNLLQYAYIDSYSNINPKILFDALIEHCNNINDIYNKAEENIVENDNVKVFLSGMLEDLELGMKMLGMFIIENV
jgi:hypothetical protein